ncbi:MAG TPA: hypothetical protein VE870_03170, partial [Bacteroidales bacterium]|nr:hypothetical protein [Bacteroidales bacterium]
MKTIFYPLLLALTLFITKSTFGQCGEGTVEIRVTVVTDLKGDADTWSLKQGSTVLLSGGPYTAGKVNTDIQTVCVPANTELFFTFKDADNDGLSTGYFKVESCDNVVAYHTGYMATYRYAWIKAQPCSIAGEGEAEIYTRIIRPFNSDHISWKITGPGGSPEYAGQTMHQSSNYEFLRSVVPEGLPLEFRIINTDGGGISLNGEYEFGYNCVNLAKGGNDFDIMKVIPFTAPYSKSSGTVFEHQVKNVDFDRASMIGELCEGGYILSGTTGPENIPPLHQAVLVKVSPSGTIIWNKEYGGGGNESAAAVIQNSDGGFTAAGSFSPDGSTNQDVYVFRTDLDGNMLWDRLIGGSSRESANAITGLAAGGFITAGTTNSSGAGSYDAYLVKLDESGNPIWSHTYGNAFYNTATAVSELPGGDLLVSGTTKFSNNQPYNQSEADAWYFRVNSNGSLVYDKAIGGSNADILNCLRVIDKNYAIAAGYTSSYSSGTKAYLVKINIATGDTVWTSVFGETGTEIIYSADVTPEGNYLLTGSQGSYYSNNQAVFIALVSPAGEILWTKTLARPGTNISGVSGVAASTGGFVLTGDTYFETFPDNRPDIYFLKTDENGELVSVPRISGDTVFCEGDKVNLMASKIDVESGMTYTWSNGDTGRIAQVTQAGEY